MISTFCVIFSLYLEFRLNIEGVEIPSARYTLLRWDISSCKHLYEFYVKFDTAAYILSQSPQG